MNRIEDIDLTACWLEEMGWNQGDPNSRKLNDEVERAFWVKAAPHYTKNGDLNKDTDKIACRLHELLGDGKEVLEIGCGTGNFTVLMARYSKRILGVDFSAAMLDELKKRAEQEGLTNIDMVNAKWEDYIPEQKPDYIVSVNSLYRIRDMEAALLKMNATASRGVIIIRTIQRPLLYPLYRDLGIEVHQCEDYQLMPLMLWRRGIEASVECIHYTRKKTYASLAEAEAEVWNDVGAAVFAERGAGILDALAEAAVQTEQGYEVTMPRTTVFIHWDV